MIDVSALQLSEHVFRGLFGKISAAEDGLETGKSAIGDGTCGLKSETRSPLKRITTYFPVLS